MGRRIAWGGSSDRRWAGGWPTLMLPAPALAGRAGAAECDRAGDADVVSGGARGRLSVRELHSRARRSARCVRDVIDDAIATSRCRSAVAPRRCATRARATCGAKAGKVTCCKGRGRPAACGDRRRAARRRAVAPARSGATESCYDACAEPPAPTPGPPTPTPPGPTPGGPCCACGCAPPYYLRLPGSSHQCSKPAPGATSNDDCEALDVPGRLGCEFLVACDAPSFPLCE